MAGEKLNPFLFNEQLFFVSNYHSKYYKVFTLNIYDKNSIPKIFYQTEHDIKLPKYKGNYLYFVEVVNSEYLLKRKNNKTNLIETITDNGVVYNYYFFETNKLALSYSNFFTPRCLAVYNFVDRTMKNISGSSIDISANYKFYDKIKNLSSAYEFYSTRKELFKGIILFFHPGLHTDFSPRWDTILMTLVENGYRIVAPNYPMSFGYGKTYSSLSLKNAVNDMINWKNYLKQKYNNKPLYFLSASSGNILMENILDKSDEDVNASVSLFGLSGNRPNNKTLYILGENDPLVNYEYRYKQLKKYKTNNSKLTIKSYANEGHWFRRKENIKDVVVEILNYFYDAKNFL